VINTIVICQLTSDQHYDYRKNLLGVGIGCHVAEAHGREAAEGEVERRNIATLEKSHRYTDAEGRSRVP